MSSRLHRSQGERGESIRLRGSLFSACCFLVPLPCCLRCVCCFYLVLCYDVVIVCIQPHRPVVAVGFNAPSLNASIAFWPVRDANTTADDGRALSDDELQADGKKDKKKKMFKTPAFLSRGKKDRKKKELALELSE
ncbi:hypothetical protein M514_28222 [Trichuris suis]|uniref:Uncharacterized protein n=1 Tax=Trichuris suis TaxID=68888 RepID=A0A085MQV6_9BILA|nr:hypothetical protein M514_28222 [Trichuris suis]